MVSPEDYSESEAIKLTRNCACALQEKTSQATHHDKTRYQVKHWQETVPKNGLVQDSASLSFEKRTTSQGCNLPQTSQREEHDQKYEMG